MQKLAVRCEDDGIEVVELGLVVFAVTGSYSEFPDNCFCGQFLAGKGVLQVLADGARIHPEQLGP